MAEGERDSSGINKTALKITILDDEIQLDKKDNNSIYNMIQKDMADDPELATYVARKMSESLTLEEANLIGDTALVVYHMMKGKGTSSEPKADE